MNLWEVRDLIASSAHQDWHVLEPGPYFHDRFESFASKGRHDLQYQRHPSRAVLMSDVDVSIEWGMDPEECDYLLENFDQYKDVRFPDKKIRYRSIDVFYRGALIDRVLVHSIDGGRAYLPLADEISDGWTVPAWEHDVTRLVDGLRGGSEFDTYFARTKWAVLR